MSKSLIVDDQPHLQELFSQELIEEVYSVVSIADAESGKEHLADSKPDLVLPDLYLNGFDGWDVLRDIRSKEPCLPVLIATACDSYVADPRVSQANGYMVKSFVDFDQLKRKIADIFGRGSIN